MKTVWQDGELGNFCSVELRTRDDTPETPVWTVAINHIVNLWVTFWLPCTVLDEGPFRIRSINHQTEETCVAVGVGEIILTDINSKTRIFHSSYETIRETDVDELISSEAIL